MRMRNIYAIYAMWLSALLDVFLVVSLNKSMYKNFIDPLLHPPVFWPLTISKPVIWNWLLLLTYGLIFSLFNSQQAYPSYKLAYFLSKSVLYRCAHLHGLITDDVSITCFSHYYISRDNQFYIWMLFKESDGLQKFNHHFYLINIHPSYIIAHSTQNYLFLLLTKIDQMFINPQKKIECN